jgi:hypothetical protein
MQNKSKKRQRNRSFLDNLIRALRIIIDTDTARDIVFVLLIGTLCTITIQHPQDYLEVFKGVLYIATGFYFRGKMSK